MTFRQEWGVDKLLSEYKVPEVLKLYYPGGVCGYDNEGCPVWVGPVGGFDWKGARINIILPRKAKNLASSFWLCRAVLPLTIICGHDKIALIYELHGIMHYVLKIKEDIFVKKIIYF